MVENQACQHGWEFLAGQYDHSLLPPAVGIMEKFDVIAPYLLPIVLIVFFAAVINIILICACGSILSKKRYEVTMKKEVPNERICIQSTFWDSLVNPSYLGGMIIFSTLPSSSDNSFTASNLVYHSISEIYGYFLRCLLSRWGLPQ